MKKLMLMFIASLITVSSFIGMAFSVPLGVGSPAEYEKCFKGCTETMQKYLVDFGMTAKEVLELTRDCAIREKCSNICLAAQELKQLR